jgi:hypothetical protein
MLFQYYVNNRELSFSVADTQKENLEINAKSYSELLASLPNNEKEFYSIIELLNKVSITAVIISFYLMILSSLQKYDLIQYTVFAFHLIDSNGLLVFLKILNQDYKNLEQQFINIYDQEVINIQYSQLTEIILLSNLKLVYKICYKNDDFIQKYLIECKMHIMLKKILNNFNNNDKIKRYCLKLFKCQLKFYDKNWRVENVNIITSIYLNLKFKNNDSIDNYLKYDKRERMNKDVVADYFMFDELKKIHLDYHLYNYIRFFNSEEEYENYQSSVNSSLYAAIYKKLENSLKDA